MGYYEISFMWKQSELTNPMYWVLFILVLWLSEKDNGEVKSLCFVLFTFAWVTFMETMCFYVGMNQSWEKYL